MSRFLKTIVNIILLCAIVVAGGLLIPPFAGVTTVIVDDVDMDTNLAKGSVTYALEKDSSELKVGNKVLLSEGDSQYVYEITSIEGDSCTLEDKLSTDVQTTEQNLGSSVKKVLFTVPFIGYVTMALRTTEGLIIVGLAVVFVIILFILAEIWKKDDEEDEDDGENSEEETDDTMEEGEDETENLSRREKKKARKAKKKEEKAAKKAAKKAEKQNSKEDSEGETVQTENVSMEEAAVTNSEESETTDEDRQLFDETSSSLAADIAVMLQGGDQADVWEDTEEKIQTVMEEPEEEAVSEEPIHEVRHLAMPVYTKEELIEKAKAAGEEPDIVEDEATGITFLDYSDIL